jgi:hypothetical protein
LKVFWNIIAAIHQRICFHPEWLQRTDKAMLTPETAVSVVRLECIRCGKLTPGWEIQGNFNHSQEYIRTPHTWVKPKGRTGFQYSNYMEIKL